MRCRAILLRQGAAHPEVMDKKEGRIACDVPGDLRNPALE
jgi:hypothetical protein